MCLLESCVINDYRIFITHKIKYYKLYIRRQSFHLLPQNSEKCIQTKQELNVYIVYSCHTVFKLFQCCVDSPVIRVMCKLYDIIANVIDFKSNH